MAALRAAVFPLSAKNRRGGHFLPPPPPVRVLSGRRKVVVWRLFRKIPSPRIKSPPPPTWKEFLRLWPQSILRTELCHVPLSDSVRTAVWIAVCWVGVSWCRSGDMAGRESGAGAAPGEARLRAGGHRAGRKLSQRAQLINNNVEIHPVRIWSGAGAAGRIVSPGRICRRLIQPSWIPRCISVTWRLNIGPMWLVPVTDVWIIDRRSDACTNYSDRVWGYQCGYLWIWDRLSGGLSGRPGTPEHRPGTARCRLGHVQYRVPASASPPISNT